MSPKESLLGRLADRLAVIGIIGLGYVGLPLMLRFIEQRFRVIGFDTDAERVSLLNRGESPIRHDTRGRYELVGGRIVRG